MAAILVSGRAFGNSKVQKGFCPVLNRCGVCRESKLAHVAAEISHRYVWDGSLPEWQGFHSFRRGLASTGVNDVMVQQILRHQDVSVTRKHYIKTAPEQSVSGIAKLEAALSAGRRAGQEHMIQLVVYSHSFMSAVAA